MISLEELTEEKAWVRVMEELGDKFLAENEQYRQLIQVRNSISESIRNVLPENLKWLAYKLDEISAAEEGLIQVAMYLYGLKDSGINHGIAPGMLRDVGVS